MFGRVSRRVTDEESRRRAKAAFDSGALWASTLPQELVERAILGWQDPGEQSSTARYILSKRAEEDPDAWRLECEEAVN